MHSPRELARRVLPARIRIGHVWMDALTFREALDKIEGLVRSRQGGSVFTPNVDHIVQIDRDEALRAAYHQASLSLVDGQPVLWAAKLLGTPVPEKISGSDLVPALMERAATRGFKVYLLGGLPGAADITARLLRNRGVRVVGASAPRIGLSPLPDERDWVEAVAKTAPDLVLVALGAPKQELWIHRNMSRLRPAVCLAVGASLDFMAGQVRRAPPWMSRAGLEWFFRLTQDPRRLARRYLVEDPRFISIFLRTLRLPRAERVSGHLESH